MQGTAVEQPGGYPSAPAFANPAAQFNSAPPGANANFEIPRGVVVGADASLPRANTDPAIGSSLPTGNCRLFKKAQFWGSKCVCGNAHDHPCHSIPHTCQICGQSFTANTNGSLACMVHPLDNIKVVGGSAHSTHQYQVYIWECCPDKPHKCSTIENFKAKGVPHGYHT